MHLPDIKRNRLVHPLAPKAQAGFSILAVLVILGVLATLGAFILDNSLRTSQSSIAMENLTDVGSAKAYINMIFRTSTGCQSALLGQQFGTELKNLILAGAASSTTPLTINYSKIGAGPASTLFAPGVRIGSLLIDSVYIGEARTLATVPVSYLIKLRIQFSTQSLSDTPSYTTVAKGVITPIYVVADPADPLLLKSCFSSIYVDSSSTTTLEDQVCATKDPAKPKFDPAGRACVAVV
jgi:type II secretory pathway pseudopilin PulG